MRCFSPAGYYAIVNCGSERVELPKDAIVMEGERQVEGRVLGFHWTKARNFKGSTRLDSLDSRLKLEHFVNLYINICSLWTMDVYGRSHGWFPLRNFDLWPILQRGMPVCQVKKKFKDLQVGDILLVTKDFSGEFMFFFFNTPMNLWYLTTG